LARKEENMGCVLCEHCTAECCRYVALPLETPTSKRDFDDIRWYLMHENITVFVEDRAWYVQFRTRCRNLQSDFRCGVYETRPAICREYKAENCDYVGGDYGYKQLFTEPDQIGKFAEEYFAKKRAAARTRKAAGAGRKLARSGSRKKLMRGKSVKKLARGSVKRKAG